mmetsp:Transcript_4644/g.7107  ORF Transcript_4644/g.7107 Transcript_4644/m.7107 type:complete len:82 (+) Transcript_4644:538-783(+)
MNVWCCSLVGGSSGDTKSSAPGWVLNFFCKTLFLVRNTHVSEHLSLCIVKRGKEKRDALDLKKKNENIQNHPIFASKIVFW